jgi:hypothetical protein
VNCVGAGRVEAGWRFRAPSGVPAQRRRVRVVGGCCGRGESRREATDGGAHRRGALSVAAVNGEASRGERRRRKKGFASTKLCRAGIRPLVQRTWRRRCMAGAWRWWEDSTAHVEVTLHGWRGDEATRARLGGWCH